MTYFKDCTNVQELKKAYRKFCKELHPDLAGKETEEEFKRMNEEYTSCLKHLSNVENLSDIENDSVHDWKNDKFAEIIQQIIKFDSMRIEIIGEWIWCFDSYQYTVISLQWGLKMDIKELKDLLRNGKTVTYKGWTLTAEKKFPDKNNRIWIEATKGTEKDSDDTLSYLLSRIDKKENI